MTDEAITEFKNIHKLVLTAVTENLSAALSAWCVPVNIFGINMENQNVGMKPGN